MTMRNTLGVLLAGGAGERLFPLTRDRAKPAVPFAGKYRIIDITLSNCINSDLRRVYILTQYKALSLNRHIREGWSGSRGAGAGRVHRDSAAHAAGQPELVYGHGGRGVPEHLFDRRRAAEVRAHPVGRPHIQDELRADARAPQGVRRGRDAGNAADRPGGGAALRRGGCDARPARSWAFRKSRRRRSCARH